MDVANFEDIGGTPFGQWTLTEVQAFVRGLSDSGLAADARAISMAGEKLADSIAELERDTAASAPRWEGEPAVRALSTMSDYRSRSYDAGVAVGDLAGRVDEVASSARETKEKFSDLDVLPWSMSAAGINQSLVSMDGVRAVVGEGVARTYTKPIQTSASTLPLNRVRIETPLVESAADLHPLSGAGASGLNAGNVGVEAGQTAGGGGGEASAANAAPSAGEDTPETKPGEQQMVSLDPASSASGAGEAGAQSAPAHTAPGVSASPSLLDAGATSGRTGDGTAPDESQSYDDTRSLAEEGGGALLSPAAAVTPGLGSAGRTGGFGGSGAGGLGGGPRVPESGRTASPLGLRQDGAIKSTPGIGSSGAVGQGARPSSSPYGVPPAGAGQRGQGDSRRRVPGYLIDRKNGDELVGDLPMVGPSVIGQWRDSAADAAAPRGPKSPRNE